ncbi:MAG: LCP family protein, partial [Eubacteriales bacterium]
IRKGYRKRRPRYSGTMSRKSAKKQQQKHAPKLFLACLFFFCAALTYLWNVWYIPYLPVSEVPPFLWDGTIANSAKTDTAVTQVTAADTEIRHSSSAAVSLPQQTNAEAQSSDSADSAASAYRRREGVYNILVAGKDDAAYNTDVLILVSFDTKKNTAAAVQIPRDTYLDGYKINALWAKYTSAARRNGSASPQTDGMEAFCDALEKTLCVRIDHWVMCSLSAFRTLVDCIGGVTVNVPCDMDYEDPAQSLSIHLKAGVQTLDGSQAEQLVRFRSGYIRGDLGRVEVQKLFLSALLDRVKNGISVLDLPGLVTTAAKAVSTSLSFSDILFFAKQAQALDMQKVVMLTLPGTDCRENGNSGAWYYILSREGTWEAVNRYLNVYETEVDGKLFDPLYRLTDPDKSTLLSYYRTYLSADARTGAEIQRDGVSVAVQGS